MASGCWDGPDPEYTGGRSTAAPALRGDNMDPPSAKTQQQWSKCQSGNSLLEADNSSGYCTSAATAGASATVTSSSPSSSSSLFSDASSSCTTIDQDMADIEYPVSPWSPPGKKTRSQLRMIPTGNKTAFLQYYYSACKAEDADDKLSAAGAKSCGPKSGVLVPRLPPTKHKKMPSWRAPKPKKRDDKYFRRHTQWMHAPYESLAKSPLNDTPTRAVMPARLKVSLQGSPAQHVTQQFPGPPRRANALRAFGSIVPGSTPESCKVSDCSYRNLPDLKYFLPPPCLGSATDWGLCRVAHEMGYAAKYSDTEEMRLDMRRTLNDLVDEIATTHPAFGPTPRDYKRWKETVEMGRVDLFHAKTAYFLDFYSRDAHDRCGTHIFEMKRLVTLARRAVRSYGPVPPLVEYPRSTPGHLQANQRRTSAPTAQALVPQQPARSGASPKPISRTAKGAVRATRVRHSSAATSSAVTLEASTMSLAATVSPPFPTAPSLPAALEPSSDSSSPPPVSPSPRPRRERAPRIVLSTRRLRSTTKAVIEPVAPTLDSGAPATAPTRRVRLRVQAPKDLPAPRKPIVDASKARQLRKTKAAALSAPEQPAYTQTRYNLRSRKRSHDEGEPAPAANIPPAPRPTKRRRN